MSTHLRIVAGASVLSIGLLVTGVGGGVASAEPATDDPTASTSSGTSHGPLGTFADNVRKAVETSLQGTVQRVTGTLNTLTKPGQIQSSIPKSPKTTIGGSPTVYGSTGTVAPSAPEAPSTAPEGSGTAPEPSSTPEDSSAAPVSSTAPIPPPPVVAPPTNKDPVAPVANAVASLANSIYAVPGVVVSLPASATPVSDVLASLQNVLTSAGDAGSSLSTLPSDLAGLLGVNVTEPTATIGASTGAARPARVVAPDPSTPVWSAAPNLPALLGAGAAAATSPATTVVPLDVATKAAAGGSARETPPVNQPEAPGKSDVLSTVEHVIGAFVATVSLTALAAVALPGILGLLTTCAAGIRVGYRQAKAASALPHTALARFVGSGPVGVVRSSSQVELRSRTTSVTAPVAPRIAVRPALRVVGSDSAATQVLDKAV